MKMKHNKKRNTAFIYEAIIRELAKAIHEGDKSKKSTIIRIIRENFGGNTLLSKDLELYKSILETKDVDQYTAEKILFQSRVQKGAINHTELFEKQSQLIETINREVSSQVFSNFVPNYKELATVFQIFHPKTKTKNRVLLEKKVLENMTSATTKEPEIKPIDNLTYKTFVSKFNEKYTSSLLAEQKALLSHFISSFSDNAVELKTYLNEEIPRLLQRVLESRTMPEIAADSDMLDKTNQIVEILKNSHTRKIDKDYVHEVLKIQNLVKELE